MRKVIRAASSSMDRLAAGSAKAGMAIIRTAMAITVTAIAVIADEAAMVAIVDPNTGMDIVI